MEQVQARDGGRRGSAALGAGGATSGAACTSAAFAGRPAAAICTTHSFNFLLYLLSLLSSSRKKLNKVCPLKSYIRIVFLEDSILFL